MNRSLFISDFKRMTRLFSVEELPEAVADYVKTIPFIPGHAVAEMRVDKDKVIGLCCQHFGMSLESMKARDRHEEIKYPRQITMYLLSRRSRMPHRSIGSLFDLDRTTVTNTKKRIDDLMETDVSIREEVEQLNAQL